MSCCKPGFIQFRQEIWDRLYAEYEFFLSQQERISISITLKDGKVVTGTSWESTPYSIIRDINQSLADNCVVAKVNGELWDLDRPLEKDTNLEVVNFADKDGEYVFWHSSAHILGEALEVQYGGHLCYGPPVESGFYYDMFLENSQVRPDDFKAIEDKCKHIVKEKQKFERLEVDVETLIEMFSYNEFKVRILREKVKTPRTTIYRCGDLIDLCRGPHVRNTGKVKAMSVVKNSASYWEGDATRESLQRVYGISFPIPKQMAEWRRFQEEAAKRDHRKIGEKQELFFFDDLSPGSCFLEPNGYKIKSKMLKFLQTEYYKRGFTEVETPTIYNKKLWQTSGHWQHYSENMFTTEIDKSTFAMKPMNCPSHCIMFKKRLRSYKDLPMRLADFGVLHRNEASGALSGLTRVRRFHQDDAHIFCTEEQILEEVMSCFDFMKYVYDILGFDFKLKLSTRPEKFMGEVEVWDRAEKQLENALNKFGREWELNPGDGAFYGPKIDITIYDALRRQHQCATIQLDFQLPKNFDLSYMRSTSNVEGESGDNKQLGRPVMIHRAIFGSFERMLAIIIESNAGRWPFWLSPFQVIVLSFGVECDSYANTVYQTIHNAGFDCAIDTDHSRTINKKVKLAQDAQYNFMLVVGKSEVVSGKVNVRTRDGKVHNEHDLEHVIHRFNNFKESMTQNAEAEF